MSKDSLRYEIDIDESVKEFTMYRIRFWIGDAEESQSILLSKDLLQRFVDDIQAVLH